MRCNLLADGQLLQEWSLPGLGAILFFFSIHLTITKPMRWMSTNGISREIAGYFFLPRSLCVRVEQVNVYVSYPR